MTANTKSNKRKKNKKRLHLTEEQAKYIIDMREARKLKWILEYC